MFDQTSHTTMYRTALAQSRSAVPAVVITPQGWLRILGPRRMELDIYSHQTHQEIHG
jgi:hypothetical protein